MVAFSTQIWIKDILLPTLRQWTYCVCHSVSAVSFCLLREASTMRRAREVSTCAPLEPNFIPQCQGPRVRSLTP